jgi:hypothetical protein
VIIHDDDVEQVTDAAAAFAAATEPEIPQIDPPGPGYVSLMYGVAGSEGERMLRAEVRELNGADEEAMARLDNRSHSYFPELVDLILRRAVTRIGDTALTVSNSSKMVGELIFADRDLLFKEIILSTFGKEREYEGVVCPSCEEPNDLHVDVEGLIEITPLEGEPVTEVTLRDGRVVALHYPTGKDQRFVYDTKEELGQASLNTRMIARCIDTVDGIEVPDQAAHRMALELGMADRRKIVDALAGGPSVKFKEVEVPCSACGENIPFAFGWADLLWV